MTTLLSSWDWPFSTIPSCYYYTYSRPFSRYRHHDGSVIWSAPGKVTVDNDLALASKMSGASCTCMWSSGLDILWKKVLCTAVAQKLVQFSICLNLSNINLVWKLFHSQNQEKIAIVPSLKIPPHIKCVATLPCEMSLSVANCRNVLLITPLVSGVASLNASSNSNVYTLNIWCKNCRMWQLLWWITETLNTLLPIVNS